MTPPPNTAGLMTPAQVLLPSARDEILLMMRTILDKCSTQISMELLDVSIVKIRAMHIYCFCTFPCLISMSLWATPYLYYMYRLYDETEVYT